MMLAYNARQQCAGCSNSPPLQSGWRRCRWRRRGTPARPSEVRVEISDRLVEEALEHLWDYSYLGSHPLASARLARSYLANGKGRETHIDRGMAVSRLLQDAIQKLKAL